MASELYDSYYKKLEEGNKKADEAIDVSTQSQLKALEENKAALEKQKQANIRSAYGDYQKQINPYGYNSELRAKNGLDNSGKSETALSNYYNTYQQRLGAIDSDNAASLRDINQNAANIRAQSEAQKLNNLANLNNSAADALWSDDANTTAKDQWQKNYDLQLKQLALSQSAEERAQAQWALEKLLAEKQEERAAKEWEYTYNQLINGGSSGGGSGSGSSSGFDEYDLQVANIVASIENEANDPFVTYYGSDNPTYAWEMKYQNAINNLPAEYRAEAQRALDERKAELAEKYHFTWGWK